MENNMHPNTMQIEDLPAEIRVSQQILLKKQTPSISGPNFHAFELPRADSPGVG
jgi:hypothetical protein